jgi:hypothetical protein
METLRFRAEVPKVAGKLAAAGVKFAFQGGGAANVADFLNNAVKSTQNGLSKDQAIRAMTMSPAEIFGVSYRMGSIETGKIANLTVVRGELLTTPRTVTHVFVDGRLFEPKPPPPSARGQRPEGDNPSALLNVGGSYAVQIQVPGQPLTGTLNLVQQGAQISGTLVTSLGTSQVRDGRVTASGFSFGGTVEFGGQTISYTVQATVTGNTFTGTLDSPQGPVPITGTKNP